MACNFYTKDVIDSRLMNFCLPVTWLVADACILISDICDCVSVYV